MQIEETRSGTITRASPQQQSSVSFYSIRPIMITEIRSRTSSTFLTE
nr:MAG TPA: hypothetical protein [Crassvirales sp.]